MWWSDLFKIWTYSFEKDPISQRTEVPTGAGVTQPDVIPDIRQDGSFWGGDKGTIRLRDSNDFIDLSSVTNRVSRYKEYQRLRNVPEIETAITVMADEACLGGNTLVATPFYGLKPIRWLATHKANERFLVYCWDFKKNDYTLGWAYAPRLVKQSKYVKVSLANGTYFNCTEDHRILKKDGTWSAAGDLEGGEELMPFFRVDAQKELQHHQFPRIFTFEHGWKTERQFIDEWREKEVPTDRETMYKVCQMVANNIPVRQISSLVDHDWKTLTTRMKKSGFTLDELRELGKYPKTQKVLNVSSDSYQKIDVFDLSVEEHENFCGESTIFHNCQIGENEHVFTIEGVSDDIEEELETLFFNRNFLNMDKKLWNITKNLLTFGDHMAEIIIDPDSPKSGVFKMQDLPPDSVYRIETTKGKLIEFQQSNEGPDYQSLTRVPVTQATEADLRQATALRFTPQQIVHWRIGDERKMFYPYGVSVMEPARGPAHQLRLMEDSMVVYRLARAPERRVFYIDIGTMAGSRAEGFVERIKDQFRKKKVASGRGGKSGLDTIEERWHPPAIDEDYWLPIRPNSNTRIETLQGAQNLGEVDDALYFRNKLFTALNFPKNYLSNEDVNVTRVSLSSQDIKFARMIERFQGQIEEGLMQIAETHLQLIGIPEERFEHLRIKITPPSEWRELSRMEILSARINNANSLKSSMLVSDYDILTQWMKHSEDEAQEMIARMKIQKLEDFKLQVMASNPQLLGIGVPSDETETEIGAQAGGPAPMLSPDMGGMPPGPGGQMLPGPGGAPEPPIMMSDEGPPQLSAAPELPEPELEDIKKYDLEILNYAKEQDVEDIDYSEMG